MLVRVAKLLDPLNSCCGCRISLENGGARGFLTHAAWLQLVWSGGERPVLFGCLFLSGGVCTKLEHHRTFVGPLVGWWVFVPVGCMFELVRGVGFGVRPVRRVAGILHHAWLVIGWDRTDHYVNLFLGLGVGSSLLGCR